MKFTVSNRCYDCSSGEFIDYENFDYEELSESLEYENEELSDDKFVCDSKDIDYEEEWYNDVNMMSADPDLITPGFVGFVHYGGKFVPAEVVSKNKRKKTCFIRFFTESGRDLEKQLVNLCDIIEFGDTEFNENIMGDDENLRERFISACIYLDNKN